ncbi:YqzM family protein [Salinicoccus sesuvii]|uniref:YqzM family protein n=1 Tax=Salinicoccus sesuvii TaxID=868281 RepID=A0ABV7N6U0_9STAP
MNKFEKHVQSKNNDISDCAIAFAVAFSGLTVIYVVAQVFQIVAGV